MSNHADKLRADIASIRKKIETPGEFTDVQLVYDAINTIEQAFKHFDLVPKPLVSDGKAARPTPLRQYLLEEGIKITVGDRNKSYGDPSFNLACAGDLKATAHHYGKSASRLISSGEWEAIDQVLTKVARLITGPETKRNTYIDGANYFAIAGEIALNAIKPDVRHKPGAATPIDDKGNPI